MDTPKNLNTASSLLNQHLEELTRFATLILGSRDEAQDVLQEAYLRLAKTLDNAMVEKPRALLFTIVGNLARDVLRRRNRWAQSELPPDLTAGDDPVASVVGAETARKIHQAVAALPPRCREVFMLRKQQNLSYREIAKTLNVSEKTVENHLASAMRSLRRKVLENSSDGSPTSKRPTSKGPTQ